MKSTSFSCKYLQFSTMYLIFSAFFILTSLMSRSEFKSTLKIKAIFFRTDEVGSDLPVSIRDK